MKNQTRTKHLEQNNVRNAILDSGYFTNIKILNLMPVTLHKLQK